MEYESLNTEFYEYLLLNPFVEIYSAIDKSSREKWEKYAFLLIDKFAIHSSSFFHLSNGIIEHRKSGVSIKANGYDLFTVNSIFRTIMETYATFNHIYVEPKTTDEKIFKFLLWKIDGLNEKRKYDIKKTDFAEAESILYADKAILEQIISDIEKTPFYRNNNPDELAKVYKSERNKYCWKFLIESGKIKPLTIMGLIEHACKTRGFINSYRHTSTHTHSSYLSIEEFEKYRGNPIPDYYTNPLTKLAIFLTSMFILDICTINNDAKRHLLSYRMKHNFL